eukprot:scaffold7802_cov71-Cyclotella_meneghiniana.AAC.24
MVASGTTLHTSYPSTNSFVRFEFEKAKLRIQIVDAKVRGTFKSRELDSLEKQHTVHTTTMMTTTNNHTAPYTINPINTYVV